MKNKLTIAIVVAFTVLLASCGTSNKLLGPVADINNRQVTQSTVSKLEKASQTPGQEAEGYFNLARIYHFDPKFFNPEKARIYYQKVLSMYQMSNYESQMKALEASYGINSGTIQNIIKNVDELIGNKAFADCVKTNTLDGYAKFVKSYPNSPLLNTVKDQALALMKSKNNINDYASYLNTFPGYKKEEVIQMAANVAYAKNTTNAYCEFLDRFADQIDDPGKIVLPFYKNVKSFADVYNGSLKNKSAQTKAKFTDQFIKEQSNYCSGNEQRIRALCKQSPFPFELSNGNKNSIKRMMQSVNVSSEMIFYTEKDKGFIQHDGNLVYEGGIIGGLRNGQGKDNYHASEVFGSGLDTYEGSFKNGYFHGNGTYTKFYGWHKTGNWNNGIEDGFFTEGNTVDHEEITLTGSYVNGKEEGMWERWECPDSKYSRKKDDYCNHWQDIYENGKRISGKEVSRGLDRYYDNYYAQNSYSGSSYSSGSYNSSSSSNNSSSSSNSSSGKSSNHGSIKSIKSNGYLDRSNQRHPCYEVCFYDDDAWFGGVKYAYVAQIDGKWYYRKGGLDVNIAFWADGGPYNSQEKAIEELQRALYGR